MLNKRVTSIKIYLVLTLDHFVLAAFSKEILHGTAHHKPRLLYIIEVQYTNCPQYRRAPILP